MPAHDLPGPTAPTTAVGRHHSSPSKGQRVAAWVQGGLAVLQLILGLDGPFLQPYWSLLWVLMLVLAVLQLRAIHQVGTEVTPAGFRVRNGLTPGRWVTWQQVEALHVQGRFEQYSTARLLSGRRVKLYGLPREAAVALVESRGLRAETGSGLSGQD